MRKDIVPEVHRQKQQVHLTEDINTSVYMPLNKKKCNKETREGVKSDSHDRFLSVKQVFSDCIKNNQLYKALTKFC